MADKTYSPKTYRKQGGDEFVVANGGKVTVESGGAIDLKSGALLKIAGTVSTASMVAAAGGPNVCEVTIQAKDANGTNLAHVVPLLVWLSDATSGAGLTATTASGDVGAKAASGTVLNALTAKKALLVQTLADGKFVLSITDTSKTLFKVCVQSMNGETPSIITLATANYGV